MGREPGPRAERIFHAAQAKTEGLNLTIFNNAERKQNRRVNIIRSCRAGKVELLREYPKKKSVKYDHVYPARKIGDDIGTTGGVETEMMHKLTGFVVHGIDPAHPGVPYYVDFCLALVDAQELVSRMTASGATNGKKLAISEGEVCFGGDD
ncbi:MAG: hypothetical protein GY820_39915 [Gammaproteobacteria bacterium]|nr:hypothetical protein [Gammaproteobacteria bacterium]